MRNKEKIAVIGTGVMGQNHSRTIAMNRSMFELTHIVDVDNDRATSVVDKFGNDNTIALNSVKELNGDNVSSAIIATPSKFHVEQAIELLNNGVNVLIEKPVGLNVEDIEKVKETSLRVGKIAMAGHIELFNPVVQELDGLVSGSVINSIRFSRLSRVEDKTRLYHDVVRDLMIHDIAIANHMIDPENKQKETLLSSYGRFNNNEYPDPAEATLRYENGTDVHFRTSRSYSGGKVRRIEVETEEGVFDADLINHSIINRRGGEGILNSSGNYVKDLRASSFFTNSAKTPLEVEHESFYKTVKGQKSPEVMNVSMDDAIRIAKITDYILSQINNTRK